MNKGSDKPAASETGNVASIMPNLFILGCGVPAATRIEIYSRSGGHAHSELEATFYACAEHTVSAATAIEQSGLTAHQMALGEDPYRAKCGASFNFTTCKASQTPEAALASSQVQADVFGDDHPTIRAAVLFICNEDLNLLPFTRRAFAVRMLGEWEHGASLTDWEREAILARFPETVVRPGPVSKADEDEIVEALCRIDGKLKAAREDEEAAYSAGHEDGYAAGYADGLSRAIDPDSIGQTDATRAVEEKAKDARGLRATLSVFQLGWKIGRGVRKTDYKRAVDLAVRILEERQAAKEAGE